MATTTASGTNRDKQGKSFVESPTRPNFTAQETCVGNVDELAQAIADAIGAGGDKDLKVETIVTNITAGSYLLTADCLNIITDATFFDELLNDIELKYQISSNSIDICSNLNFNNVTIRLEGV